MAQLTLPAGALADLRRAIEEIAATEAVKALREAGRRLAAEAEIAIANRGGRPLAGLAFPTFWAELDRYFESAGWGHIEHRELNEGVGAIVASEWAESDPTEGRDAPGCHLSTGLLAELLTSAVGRPVAVMEVECRSRGDEACRFLFGSPVNLLLVHKKLTQSSSLEDALAAL